MHISQYFSRENIVDMSHFFPPQINKFYFVKIFIFLRKLFQCDRLIVASVLVGTPNLLIRHRQPIY